MFRAPPRTVTLAIFACALALAGCGKATEIVVRLDVVGEVSPPPQIDVKLRRSTPFPTELPKTPDFVEAALNGAELLLNIKPQGPRTTFSLVPSKDGGPRDLQIVVTVPAPGWQVMPAEAASINFVDGESQTLIWTISAPPPDGGAPRDMAAPAGDGGARDMAQKPVDLRPGN